MAPGIRHDEKGVERGRGGGVFCQCCLLGVPRRFLHARQNYAAYRQTVVDIITYIFISCHQLCQGGITYHSKNLSQPMEVGVSVLSSVKVYSLIYGKSGFLRY